MALNFDYNKLIVEDWIEPDEIAYHYYDKDLNWHALVVHRKHELLEWGKELTEFIIKQQIQDLYKQEVGEK